MGNVLQALIFEGICDIPRTKLAVRYLEAIESACAVQPVVYSVLVMGGNVIIKGFFSTEDPHDAYQLDMNLLNNWVTATFLFQRKHEFAHDLENAEAWGIFADLIADQRREYQHLSPTERKEILFQATDPYVG